MPRFHLKLHRIKPGRGSDIDAEHGTTTVEADDAVAARQKALDLAQIDSGEIVWESRGPAVPSGGGGAHVVETQVDGPKASVLGAASVDLAQVPGKARSALAQGDSAAEPRDSSRRPVAGQRMAQFADGGNPSGIRPAKMPAGAKPINPDEQGGYDGQMQGDSSTWTEQQQANSEVAQIPASASPSD